jgi:hypothetical protein
MQGRNIATEELKELIRGLTDGLDLWDDDNDWRFLDGHFYLPSEQETMTVIAAHRQATADKGLVLVSDRGEGYDCDDYTKSLFGFVPDFAEGKKLQVQHSVCIGMAIGVFGWMDGLHSCNWVFLSDGRFKWIEPQTGHLHNLPECMPYSLRFLIV